jgi:hypothetical protein
VSLPAPPEHDALADAAAFASQVVASPPAARQAALALDLALAVQVLPSPAKGIGGLDGQHREHRGGPTV